MGDRRNIVLGVTGSIAAYKAAELTSQLVKQGCEVHVIMTADAQRFITPLPFKTLSRQPVITDLYAEEEGWKPTHIKLADEADLLLIAPATANTIAKLALGLANDSLSCVALALNPKARVLIAP
ncbi:MAG TPA: flavoprotein, partial [Bacillota bacterium]|nr:flavoprotein [Bacillota bacterium]